MTELVRTREVIQEWRKALKIAEEIAGELEMKIERFEASPRNETSKCAPHHLTEAHQLHDSLRSAHRTLRSATWR